MSAPPPSKTLELSQKETLISLTALLFIEEHHLLPSERLADAKSSLQALFLRTSGEETFLRKLIDILRMTHGVQRAFAQIANTLDGIRASAQTIENKLTALRVELELLHVSAEEYEAFVGPFLSFSQTLSARIGGFARTLDDYLQMKEEEARQTNIYRIAREARDRLKQRLAGNLGAETAGETETRIKKEVVSAFDFSEAETNLKYARRDSKSKEAEVRAQLADIEARCQQAMNPVMRDKDEDSVKAASVHDDVFTLFADALRRYPRLLQIKEPVIALFKMYQHTYGMFVLDLQHLARAMATMNENPDAYFESKEEDIDLRSKREKLHRIEGLIPFLERSAETLTDEELDVYPKLSRRLSDLISEAKAPWAHIGPELLRAKVQAEAELSTRL